MYKEDLVLNNLQGLICMKPTNLISFIYKKINFFIEKLLGVFLFMANTVVDSCNAGVISVV